MEVAHFYHCWVGGEWRRIVLEHLAALESAAFDGPFYVGLVGTPEARCEALSEIERHRRVDGIAAADSGYEQVTIHALHEYAKRNGGAVLYAHTKGAWHVRPDQEALRRMMTSRVVLGWRDCLGLIAEGCEAVGCVWRGGQNGPHFSGNFWMASCAYVSGLPRCPDTGRHHAEMWIGGLNPRAAEAPLHHFGLEPASPAAVTRRASSAAKRMRLKLTLGDLAAAAEDATSWLSYEQRQMWSVDGFCCPFCLAGLDGDFLVDDRCDLMCDAEPSCGSEHLRPLLLGHFVRAREMV
jgi:hypothetical protein